MDITLESVFLKLVNMSISASWLVLAVILLRFVLRKAPKSIRCILWGLVAIRLLCPFSFESVLSLIPSAETLPREFLYAATPQVNTGIPALNSAINPMVAESLTPVGLTSANPTQILSFIYARVWIIGMVIMVLCAAFSYVRIRRKVQASIRVSRNLYLCDYIDTPFILGIIRPKIYLPSAMEQQNIHHVLAHEQAHLTRRDHWWKPLGFVLLSVYWFNPLMWITYILLCRDIELACDETVVSNFSTEEKKAYSSALLSCSIPRHMIAACPLAFGEVGIKTRIKSVLNYKKPAFWVMIVAVAACIAVAVCFLTDPVKNTDMIHLNRLPEGNYVTGECLYFHPVSSGRPSGQGDYSFTATYDGIKFGQGKYGELFSVSGLNWGWTDECPLSSEQLLAFYEFFDILSDDDPILGTGCRYQKINEEYFLAEHNGSIYLVNWLPQSADAFGYIWSIFEVVPSQQSTLEITDMGKDTVEATEMPMVTSRPELAFPGLEPYQSIVSEEIYEVTRDGAYLEYQTTYTSPTIRVEIGLISTDDGTEIFHEVRDGSAQGVIEDIPIGNYQLYVKNIGCINAYEPVSVEGGAVACDLVGGKEVKEILQSGQTLHDLTTGELEITAAEADQYVFWTNSKQIAVTVESGADFNGTVYLGATDAPEQYLMQFQLDSDSKTNSSLFSGLTAARYYTLHFENLDGCTITVGEELRPSWLPDWIFG